MSHILKNLYDNLVEPVLVYNKKKGTFFVNNAFKSVFSISSNDKLLNKLEYRFSYDVCMLESEKLTSFSPINAAINCKYNFSCYSVFQKNEDENLYFIIKAITLYKWRVLYFYDITHELNFEKMRSENKELKVKNTEFLKTNLNVQNQAVKMSLLNRVITNLRNSLDVKELIEKAFYELSLIFKAKKLYFAKFFDDEFEIKKIYPEKYSSEISKTFKLQESVFKKILSNECIFDVVIDEIKTQNRRIILPIFNHNKLFGVICIYSFEKNVTTSEKELLKNIAMQISDAIYEANLFDEIRRQKEELQTALNNLKETQLQLINSEKMASLGQLIASVAHEINTPLAAISANNEILTKFFKDLNNEMLIDINNVDREAIKRITNIVTSLKRFVRLDEEKRQETNINEELDLTLALLHQRTKRGIKIVKNYQNVPYISCFPNMLNQVFLNVLMNSVQAIEEKKTEGEISIETMVLKNNLVIKIEDDGVGMTEETKEKVFNAGFTTKKVGTGTGLGLAISKKIIDEHKGKIEFETKPNKGTICTITIPYV